MSLPSAGAKARSARAHASASVFVERLSASSAARSSVVRLIAVAQGIDFIQSLNYDSRSKDSGYWRSSSAWPVRTPTTRGAPRSRLLGGGFNVYPRNFEAAIYQHPSVEEASVIGFPTPIAARRGSADAGRREEIPQGSARQARNERRARNSRRTAEDRGRKILEEGLVRSRARRRRLNTSARGEPRRACRGFGDLIRRTSARPNPAGNDNIR